MHHYCRPSNSNSNEFASEWVCLCVCVCEECFLHGIRWLLVELKSNSSIWTLLYPIQDVAVDVRILRFFFSLRCFHFFYVLLSFGWICHTNVQTQLLFVHFEGKKMKSTLFYFELYGKVLYYWWNVDNTKIRRRKHTPAQKKWKGAKRIPFNAHIYMIAMFTQIYYCCT